MSSRIERVDACEALDSRGRPTVSARVWLASGAAATATVPSGKSTGTHEAVEVRDGDARFGGDGVLRAVDNVRAVLGPAVTGLDTGDQATVDAALRAADGTASLQRLGANAVLAVSIAVRLAAAADARRAPFTEFALMADASPVLPMPMVNIVSGGAHAGGAVDVQDFLAIPLGARDVSEAIDIAAEIRAGTAEYARRRGHETALTADEGGIALTLGSNRAVLEFLAEGAALAGIRDFGIAIDIAAHQLATPGGYQLAAEGRVLTTGEWLDELARWTRDYPIVSIEDPLDEDDWDGWAQATQRLGHRVQLVGDDLFVTDPDRVARGIAAGVANAVLIKPNQVGTLTDALAAARTANQAGYRTVLSARSGDTEDSWLADLAVGWATGQIKVGSTTRSERTSKWNRLRWIEREWGASATFAGMAALRVATPEAMSRTTRPTMP